MRMRTSWPWWAATLLVLTCPGGLSAQGGVEWTVYPRAGLAAPDTYFYEYFKNFYGDGPMEWTSGSLGRAFTGGVGVQVKVGDGLRVRAEVLRTVDGWLRSVHTIEKPRIFFDPPELINTWLDIPTSVTHTSIQIVLPTRLVLWGVEPYVLAGIGGKLYDFGAPLEGNEVDATLPADGFTWGGDLGAGVTFPFWRGLEIDLQLRDALSRYWGKTQHDLLYTAAVLWSIS
jgi:hypothetical protein